MRLTLLRFSAIGVFALTTAGGVVASPTIALASRADTALAPGLVAVAANAAPAKRLRVIVEGPGAAAATAAVTGPDRRLGLGAVAATVAAKDLRVLAGSPGVTRVAADAPVSFTAVGAISAASLATTYPVRDAVSKPWSAGVTGQGVGIAVIDSGVTPSDAFGSRLVQVAIDGQTGPLDDIVGHGTMVAGVASGNSPDGNYIGIAPGATIYAININHPAGVYTSDVITALKWVFDNAHAYNIRVVNLSLTENVQSSYKNSPLDLAVERLWASGVFVAVAAGNRGAGEIDYAPANDPLVLAAGAFDTKDTSGGKDDALLSWSSRGTTVDGFVKPEMVLPGRHIAAPLPSGTYLDGVAPSANRVALGYAAINGTSFSAPQVAGAAAILFQKHPDWSPDNVKWLLLAKPGAKPKNSTAPSLNLGPVFDFNSTPGRANQGVAALVCAPGTNCVSGSTVASSWDSSSWSSSSWSSSSWSSSSWSSSSWSSVADWTSSSWSSTSWSSSSWSSTSWTTSTDSFDPWG